MDVFGCWEFRTLSIVAWYQICLCTAVDVFRCWEIWTLRPVARCQMPSRHNCGRDRVLRAQFCSVSSRRTMDFVVEKWRVRHPSTFNTVGRPRLLRTHLNHCCLKIECLNLTETNDLVLSWLVSQQACRCKIVESWGGSKTLNSAQYCYLAVMVLYKSVHRNGNETSFQTSDGHALNDRGPVRVLKDSKTIASHSTQN